MSATRFYTHTDINQIYCFRHVSNNHMFKIGIRHFLSVTGPLICTIKYRKSACTQLYILVHTWTILYKFLHTCTQLYTIIHICIHLYKLVQHCIHLYTCTSHLYNIVHICTYLYTIVNSCAHLYKLYTRVNNCTHFHTFVHTCTNFLIMNTELFEICQGQYNWINYLLNEKKCASRWFLLKYSLWCL
jgi:hypothetical protein